MPMPLFELPVIVTTFLMQPATSPPERPAACTAREAHRIADCCIDFTGWEQRSDWPVRATSALGPGLQEGRARRVHL